MLCGVSQRNKYKPCTHIFSLILTKVTLNSRFLYKDNNQHCDANTDNMEEKLYQWATSRCSKKELCRSELARKMMQKGASPSIVERILQRLENERYVDESRYARAFVSDKLRFDCWGRIKISCSLKQKGIADSIIEEALSEIEEEPYINALKAFLTNKMKTTKGETTYDIKRKIARSAITRGYEPQLVFSHLAMEEMD